MVASMFHRLDVAKHKSKHILAPIKTEINKILKVLQNFKCRRICCCVIDEIQLVLVLPCLVAVRVRALNITNNKLVLQPGLNVLQSVIISVHRFLHIRAGSTNSTDG